ncbi:cytochrome P450 [Microdochium bolleyi]|uniref:Cytochrome P450 n=1 Tax=Microdochium bolleyi TaxID=196109 RepID=A0A136J4H9_9PEZI|nr:cytochrome P450 [Microdochium bolleyi]
MAAIVNIPLVFGQRMYVVTDPTPVLVSSFVTAATLRLASVLPELMKSWAPFSSRAQSELPVSFKRWLRVMPGALSGAVAQQIHRCVIPLLAKQIEAVRAEVEEKGHGFFEVEDLAKWLSDLASRAMMVGMGGREWSWCQDQDFLDAFWSRKGPSYYLVNSFVLRDYGTTRAFMLTDVIGPIQGVRALSDTLQHKSAPSFTAPRSTRARNQVLERLSQWMVELENNPESHSKLSAVARTLFKLPVSQGWSTHDKAATTLIMLCAGLSNEVPTVFWIFVNILTRPDLLARLRREGDAFLHGSKRLPGRQSVGDDDDVFAMAAARLAEASLPGIQSSCHLLYACYQEAQRLATVGPVLRRVSRDTIIQSETGSFLLKKGSLAFLPTNVLHLSQERWGEDAAMFVSERPGRKDVERARALIPALRPWTGVDSLRPTSCYLRFFFSS